MKPRHWLAALVCSALAAIAACVGDDPVGGDGADDDSPDATLPDARDAIAPDPASRDAEEDHSDALAQDAGTDAHAPELTVLQVDLLEDAGCALLSNRKVWCWGNNSMGQLGIVPDTVTGRPPAEVPGLDEVVSISGRNQSICAVRADNTVWCWGKNTEHQLGRTNDVSCAGQERCAYEPAPIPGLVASAVSVAYNAFACAITTTKSVYCWGHNVDGQTGAPSGPTPEAPHVVAGITNVARLNLGHAGNTVCVTDDSNRVWCWGKNELGQLGHSPGAAGDLSYEFGYYKPTPTLVTMNPDGTGAAFDNVLEAAVGSTVCAIRLDGTTWCWGENRGNLVVPYHPDGVAHPTPTKIEGIEKATAIGSGGAMCVLGAAGAVVCWGGGDANATQADAGCVSPLGTPGLCAGVGKVNAPGLASLDADHLGYAGVTLGTSATVDWGNGDNGRLGRPPSTDGGHLAPGPVVGLP